MAEISLCAVSPRGLPSHSLKLARRRTNQRPEFQPSTALIGRGVGPGPVVHVDPPELVSVKLVVGGPCGEVHTGPRRDREIDYRSSLRPAKYLTLRPLGPISPLCATV